MVLYRSQYILRRWLVFCVHAIAKAIPAYTLLLFVIKTSYNNQDFHSGSNNKEQTEEKNWGEES